MRSILLFAVALGCGATEPGNDLPDAGSRDAESDPDASVVPILFGAVSLRRDRFESQGSAVDRTHGSAYFDAYQGDRVDCSREQIASCELATCEDVEPPARFPDSGSISVDVGGRVIRLEPSSTGEYGPVLVEALEWQAGELATFSSEGGEVPAFQAELTTPQSVVLSEALPADPFDRTAPLELAWSGGSGTVQAILSATLPDGRYLIAICDYDASLAGATIPPDLLSRLPAGPTSFVLIVRRKTSTPAGRWSVELAAEINAVDLAGELVAEILFLR